MGFTDKATSGLKKMGGQFERTSKSITSKVGGMAKQLAKFASVAGVAGATLAIGKSVSAFTSFEDAMAGVKKTTGMSSEAIADLADGIKGMTKSIPLGHDELANIAAVAGQLGIQGKENILDFTDTAAKMATAFDMPAEKAATVAAKLTNIYGLGIDKASNLASAINVLGNTTAASESQISDYAMSLGASAVNMGFSSTESVAMGASLISMGMDASDAGTRLNAAFVQMGTKIEEISGFLGMTEEDFSTAFGEDPMAMLMQITEKLGKIEDPLERARVSSELFGRVGGKAITGLGGNLEGLQTNLDNAAQGFIENTSLEEEFAAKTDTLKAKFQFLRNALNDAAITIGTALAPYMEKLAKWITDMVPKVMEFAGKVKKELTPAFNAFVKFIKDNFPKVKKWIKGIIDKLKDILPKIKDLIKHIAKKLEPALKDIHKIVKNVGKIFGTLTSELGDSDDAFASITSIANTAIDVLTWLIGVISDVVNWFAEHPTITKFAIAIAAAVALITSPILLIIAALALLAIAWDNDWLGIKTTTLNIVDAIKPIIGGLIDVISAIWGALGDVKDWLSDNAATLWDTFNTAINTSKVIMNPFGAVLGYIWDNLDEIRNWLSTNGSGLWDAITTATDTLKTTYLDPLITVLSNIMTWFADLMGIEFSWPTIPNPFADIDFCAYIPDWFAKWMGICGEDACKTCVAECTECTGCVECTDCTGCVAGCTEGCVDECTSGCTSGCTQSTGCTDSCTNDTGGGGGGGGCTDSCTDSCVSGCTNDTGGCDDCTGGCLLCLDCTVGCTTDDTGCTGCTGSCTTGCTQDCTGSCTGCTAGCVTDDTGCEGCTGCTSGCTGGCTDSCTGDCTSGCTSGCTDDCTSDTGGGGCGSTGGCSGCTSGTGCGCTGKPDYQHGGYVGKSGGNAHEGEWVIPTKGGPVMTGGKDTTLNMTYNIDKIVGVSDFERLLEKHDRELFKKLRALV